MFSENYHTTDCPRYFIRKERVGVGGADRMIHLSGKNPIEMHIKCRGMEFGRYILYRIFLACN